MNKHNRYIRRSIHDISVKSEKCWSVETYLNNNCMHECVVKWSNPKY